MRSFNIGITGLAANGQSMSITGDNIANAGTTGFKASRAEFQDILAVSLKGVAAGGQIGAGTRLGHVKVLHGQGDVTRTDSNTDLAINGEGFFIVDAPFGSGYTRDGSFHFNKSGELVTGDRYKVLGFEYRDGKKTTLLKPISLTNANIQAKATKEIELSMNLDTRVKPLEFDSRDAEATSHFSSGLAVYDNLGTQRLVTLYFNKIEDNQWEYHAMVDGTDAADGKKGELVEMGAGRLQFDDNGLLKEEIESKNSFNFSDGARPGQKIKINFGKSLTEGGDGLRAITQYGIKSNVARHTQNGFSAGTLANLAFDDKGVMTAAYTNGELREIAQVALAKFEDKEGLFKMGKNLYKRTRTSGQAAVGGPEEAGRGEILSKSLELSNVDLAKEFVALMTQSRNFKANGKVITTADEMAQEVLTLKR